MGLRDPFLIRSPEGDRFFLIATDLSIGRNGDWDRSQRTGSKYLEIWESTDLINWSEQRHVQGLPRHGRQHLGPGGLLGRGPPAVRRVLGLQAVRRGRPEPHRQHLQPDALRHDARLRHLQRGADLAGPQRVAHRLHRDQGERHLLPLHQGRGRRRHRLLRHHPGEVLLADRGRPAGQPVLGLHGRLHRPRRRHLRRRGPDRLQGQPGRHLRLAVLPLRRRVRRPRLHPARHRRPGGPGLAGGRRLQPARQPAPRHRHPGHPGRARRAARGDRHPRAAHAGRGRRERAGRPLRARRDVRHHGVRQHRPRVRRHRQRRRDLGRRRAHPRRHQRPREAARQHDGRPRGDHRLDRGVGRPDPGRRRTSSGAWATPTRWHRQRLPVHHRQRLPVLDRHRQLDHGADRHVGGEPGPRRLEDADLHAVARRRRHALPRRREGRREDRRDDRARRHRRRCDHGQLHRPLGLHRRQVPQGQGARLPHLQPGPVGRRGQRDGCGPDAPSSVWSSTA